MATWKEGVVYRYVATGLVLTSLLFSACGDDDDDGPGSGGSSGASTAGKGGNATAGKGTTAGSSNGGSAAGAGPATAGSGQGGAGGDTGQAGSTAAGGGGAPTTAGAGGSDGGSAGATQGGSGGSGGGEPATVEYRACEQATALTRIAVHRIDEDAGTCTRVVLLQGSNCSLGVAAGGWCLEQAQLSSDVTACKALMVPASPKLASSATGSISVTGSTADVNVTLTFPAGGDLPTSITVAADDCTADCMMNDCRP